MTHKKYRAKLLKSDCDYRLDQDFAETFRGMDIDSCPKTETEYSGSVGVIEDAWYNKSLFANVTIYDEKVVELLDEGDAKICPTVARDIKEPENLEALDVFVSVFPANEVGEVEEFND